MSVSVAAPPSSRAAAPARPGFGFGSLYGGGVAFWLLTRCLVLVHQGAWPWMNAFVVAAARGIVVGDWNEAVRPVLPAMLGVPLVLAGATEQQAVAGLYVVASLVQFGCFVVLIRTLWPGQLREQSLALLLFLLVPYNHSIHHYRDVPVVFANCAIYLLASAWLRTRVGRGTREWHLIALGAIVLGVWSRMEVLAFVGILCIFGLLVYRRSVARLAASYLLAGILGITTLFGVARLTGVDLGEQAHYQFHTFLDSTPDSWLTPECRATPTENCREADGLRYFGPAEPQDGVWPMVFSHPWTTVEKSVRSAFDNAVIIYGANISTYPGYLALLALALLLSRSARQAVRKIPLEVWLLAAAAVAESVVPPLSWAPPHPQYHLQTLLAVLIVGVPVLSAILRATRGQWLVATFFAANLVLSALRYTRYAGP
jgi:hypothetical protein